MPIYVIKDLPGVGEIVVWGSNANGQVDDKPPGHDFREVILGGATQSLALRRDGSLALWGGSSKTPVPPLPTVPSVTFGAPFERASLGLTHLLAFHADGSLIHWGQFAFGTPVIPPPGEKFSEVAAAGGLDVGIDLSGDLQVWGSIGPPPKGKFTAVRARGDYALALRWDGRLYAWGGDIFADASQPKNYPLPQSVWNGWTRDAAGYFFVPGPFVAFDAGIVQKPPDVPKNIPHVIAINAAGKVTGWGADKFGEASGAPSGVQFRGVAAGNAYSLGLDTSGEIHHWGNRHEGVKLAGGTFGLGGRHLPKGPFISISAGAQHATAIRVSRMQLHEGPDAR